HHVAVEELDAVAHPAQTLGDRGRERGLARSRHAGEPEREPLGHEVVTWPRRRTLSSYRLWAPTTLAVLVGACGSGGAGSIACSVATGCILSGHRCSMGSG